MKPTARAELLEAYKRVSLDELFKVANTVEDALVRWESRVKDEPALRIRIRQGYEALEIVQEAMSACLESLEHHDVELH